MDDGTANKVQGITRAYVLNTQNFTYAEHKILVKALHKVFGLHVNIHRDGTRYKLYILAESKERFYQIVKPYILPSFHYKL